VTHWSGMFRHRDRTRNRVRLRPRWVFYPSAICSALALAQTTPEFMGHWSARSVSPTSGFELRVELVLAESGSTWTYTPGVGPSRDNPCFKKAFPVRVVAATAPELTLQVDGSMAMAGCPDFVVLLKRVDEKTYDAQFADGRHLEFARAQ
jgi:hypothetical protein